MQRGVPDMGYRHTPLEGRGQELIPKVLQAHSEMALRGHSVALLFW